MFKFRVYVCPTYCFPSLFPCVKVASGRIPGGGGGGGGTLGIFGWGCAAGTLEALAYTRASSAEFCYPILVQD